MLLHLWQRKDKKEHMAVESHCATSTKQQCAQNTLCPHSVEHLEAVLFFGIQCWYALRAVTTSGLGPSTFSSVCLEIIGPGSIGVYLSRLRSSQMFVTLSSTISWDTHFAWNTLGTPRFPPLGKLHSRYLNLALTLISFTTLPQLTCLPLCLAAHFHSLSCLHPFCMCEFGSELPVHEGKLILFFCTYS